MPAADGGGRVNYNPPIKKKRKPRPTSYTDPGAHIGGSRPSYSSPSRNVGHSTYYKPPARKSSPSYSRKYYPSTPKTATYHAPYRPTPSRYTPPPSYSIIRPKKVTPPKPKPPSVFEVLRSVGLDFGKPGEDKFRPPKPTTSMTEPGAHIENPDAGLFSLLNRPLSGDKQEPLFGSIRDEGLSPGMQKFLDSLKGVDRAPEGYTPGAENMKPGEFAWVPERFKTLRNGRLKNHWDLEFIKSSREDFAFPNQFESFLNDMMEQQFLDREKWLLGKNERKYNRIKEILGDASQAAFQGDYDYLEREHPNFDPSVPTYRSQFGITPEGIVADWKAKKGGIKDPYMVGPMRERMDEMRKHYEKLRSGEFFSFQQTNNLVQRAIKKYETKYNDSVEFGINSHDEERQAAAKSAGPAFDQGRSKAEQAFADKVGESQDPRVGDVFSSFYAGGTKMGRRMDKRAVAKARSHAMSALGTPYLPTVKQMITYSVSNGDLNPNDEEAVEDAIDRYKNPNHPDTRAMYVAFTMSRNPSFDAKGKGLEFINDPVVQYQKQQQENAEAEQRRKIEEDEATQTGVFDFVSDLWKSNPIIGKGVPLQDVRAVGGGGTGVSGREGNEGALNASQLGWTFDKLSRLNYGVAGMANAWYGLDKDPRSTSWVERVLDPISLVTGQSTIDSLDEVLKDPSGLGKVFDEGYQQVFRGSGLKGIREDIVPITFSHVIANAAARDPENNVYDKDWYQHISGFALDVALDPLNLVGVGIVDDVLKVPTRVAKAMKAAEKADEPTTEIINFLTRVDQGGRSPIVEKVFRTDQAIRRIGDDVGTTYTDDADIWMPDNGVVNTYDHDAVLRNISNQMDDLRIQEAKLKNDLGIEAMTDELRHLTDLSDGLAFRSKVDFRFNRIAQRTSIKVQDTKLDNPGGMFWRDYIDPLEKGAISRGFFDTEYAPTSIGKAAERAESDLSRLLDDIDEGKVHEADPAVAKKKADLERTIDEAYAVDEATGKPAVTKKPRIEEYRKSSSYQRPRLDPAKELAAAAKMSKEDFAKHFSDEDVHKALTLGPKMLVESDEVSARLLADANERIHYAKEQLKDPRITDSKKKAVQRALATGYTMQSSVTIEGMLRYLDLLQDMRKGGVVAQNADVQSKISKLEDAKTWVDTELEKHPQYEDDATGYLGSKTMDLEDTPTDSTGRKAIERKFEGQDFTDPEIIDELLGMGGKSTVEDLTAMKGEIETQIGELLPQLRNTDEVTGFPPAVAIQVEKMLPGDSVFRTKGVIDGGKVARQLDFNPKTHEISYRIPEGSTKEEAAFLDIVKETIVAEYNGAYRAVKTEMVMAKQGDEAAAVDAPAVGPKERELGPRPNAKNLREQYPEIFAKYVQGKTKDVKETSTSSPEGWLHSDEDVVIGDIGGVKGVPGQRVAKAEQNLARTGGKRSKSQKTLDEFIARKQKAWDKQVVRARELDKAAARKSSVDYKVTPAEREMIAPKAYKRALDGVTESLKMGKINRVPGNMRLTINENAKSMLEGARLQHRADAARLKIDELNATSADEFRAIKAKRAALDKQLREHEAGIEAARKKAHETKANMARIVKDEHALQISQMPPRATGRQIQFRIMGMRKNMQFSNNLFKSVEKAADLVPAKFRENFANYMVRPTKQLDTEEAIMFRAQWESKTPVIIKAHLERLSRRMRDIPEAERVAMMKAYRDNVDYEGPHMDLYDEAMKEVRGVEFIWNGADPFYWVQPKRGQVANDVIGREEVYRFLPEEYRPSMRHLYRYMEQDGAVTAKNLLEAVKANGGKVQDLLDPFTFSWVMRMAADQARQYKALTHSIETTFGVHIDPSKVKFENKLKETGWAEVKGLSGLFPPEAMHDVEKLLELAKPGKPQREFTKMADTALGYWKQSMTIYNPGYYTRNGIGEMMTSWLDGVNHPKWYRMAYRVWRYTKREDSNLAQLVERWPALNGKIPVDEAKGGEVLFKLPRSGVKVTVDEALKWAVNTGIKSTFANTDIGQGLRGLGASALHDSKFRKGASKANAAVHEFGEGFEDYLRMAHFLHAMEHSGQTTIHKAAEYARQRVTRSHFDYTDFSTFEKTVMLRAFPFYKWTRRGAPLMFSHLFLTPGKMAALPKAMDTMSGLGVDPVGFFNEDPVMSTSDVHDDKNGHLPDYQGIAPGWVRDLFAYQISPAEDDEYGNYFRIQTPQVDGLNSVLNAMPIPGTDNQAGTGMEMFTESGAYPLLNPAIKGAIELTTNQSMDPDFPFPIAGGEYNELNGINPVEAIGTYIARSTNPVAGFLAKLSKNGNLGPLSMGDGSYREEHGYNESRDVASFLTGLGFYQATSQTPVPGEAVNPGAVGKYELSDIPEIRGRKAAGGYGSNVRPSGNGYPDGSMNYDPSGSGYAGGNGWIDYGNGSGWINYPDWKKGNGWINYPDSKWIDYPDRNWVDYGSGGGYSSGGYGGGYSSGGGVSTPSGVSGGSGGGMEFWNLIQELRRLLDQGDVTGGE